MTSCILTIIKNEHQYLDEWIQYHLGIGVNHIFIFEDIDSDSHSYITARYPNQVTLQNISSILSDSDLVEAKRFKITKQKNPQEIYLKRGLLYLSLFTQFDWCFAIDVDEFLTFTDNSTSLNQTLASYQNYNAIILQWKCFGANGIVKMPDYHSARVVETYTEPILGHIPTASLKSFTKTCYNLRTYRPEFFWYSHQPSSKCNFCRTDFSKDREREIYDVMYLRHYITKSWEEYLWKKKTRGYFFGKVRTLSAFFEMNPELAPQQDRLLYESDDRKLVVLPYIQSRAQGQEIRLALSGWRKYCQSEYDFIVVGEFDHKLQQDFPWVKFIELPRKQKVDGQYNPHLDMQNKMEFIYRVFSKRYSGFIWMVDDNYAIKPFSIDEMITVHKHRPSFTGEESAPTSFWRHDKWKTRQLLDANNLPHINYTTHFPCYFSFERLKALWDKYDMRNNSYVVEDIYFNTYPHEEPVQDGTIRYGIWGPKQMGAPLEAAIASPNIKFLCNSVEGWSLELEQILSNLILESNP